MNYSKVQFISWELDTTPVSRHNRGYYPGIWNINKDVKFDIESQANDIVARVECFKSILNNMRKCLNPSSDVLKIFIAPEFLFRGAAGAYLLDLLNGWKNNAPIEFNLQHTGFEQGWLGLFGLLNEELSKNIYENCLFVMGTAVGASYSTQNGMIDFSKHTEAYNYSFVKLGGDTSESSIHICRKRFKSNIDFLDFTSYYAHVQGDVKYMGDEFYDIDGVEGAVFSFDKIRKSNGEKITFGLEICLDHINNINNGQREGLIKNMGILVNIQLVPSCGMWLHNESLSLKDGCSYAINCDGSQSQSNILSPRGETIVYTDFKNPEQIYFNGRWLESNILWKKGSGKLSIYTPLPMTD